MSVGQKAIPEGITIDGIRYEPMVIQRNGVHSWNGRWMVLISPTPIAYSLNLHFYGLRMRALAVPTSSRNLPPQLR